MFDSAKYVEQIESPICKWAVFVVSWMELVEVVIIADPLHFLRTSNTSTVTILHIWWNGYRDHLKSMFKQAFAAAWLLLFCSYIIKTWAFLSSFRHIFSIIAQKGGGGMKTLYNSCSKIEWKGLDPAGLLFASRHQTNSHHWHRCDTLGPDRPQQGICEIIPSSSTMLRQLTVTL